eukprot:2491341-Rhodomonas_salina.1
MLWSQWQAVFADGSSAWLIQGAEGASTEVAGQSSWLEVEEADGLKAPLALGRGGGNCMG